MPPHPRQEAQDKPNPNPNFHASKVQAGKL